MQAPSCSKRPGCGGATFCSDCIAVGVSRADGKLLQGSVASARLSEIVASVWPEATRAETVVAAASLVKSGIAVPCKHNASVVEHRLWPALRKLVVDADEPLNPAEYFESAGMPWALPLLTDARLSNAGLHLFAQPGTSQALVRRKTRLNAVDADTLLRALRSNGSKGTQLETVFMEYAGAFHDLFRLAASGAVTVDEGMAWHAQNVPCATPGALTAWRRALAVYKPTKPSSSQRRKLRHADA